MDFNFTREQELVRQMLKEFVEKEVKPISAHIDETEEFPMENVKKMARYGIMGIPFPREYGGAGGDDISYIISSNKRLAGGIPGEDTIWKKP
jgi:butyryl-CoA dehydrogenase